MRIMNKQEASLANSLPGWTLPMPKSNAVPLSQAQLHTLAVVLSGELNGADNLLGHDCNCGPVLVGCFASLHFADQVTECLDHHSFLRQLEMHLQATQHNEELQQARP